MYYCDICGRASNKKIKSHGYCLCSKHAHQLFDHGKFLDNIQRTVNDLNDYMIKGNVVIFNLYNQKNIKIGEFIVDFDFIELVKYHKWRFSHSHVVTGSGSKVVDLAWLILGVTSEQIADGYVVDHINGNGMDNRKCNLRLCRQSENAINRSYMSNNTSEFIGVSYRKERATWDSEIRRGSKRCHLGQCKTKIEAVYKRYIAEQLVFGEYANADGQKRKAEYTSSLTEEQKTQIEQSVKKKLQDKGLWQ